MAEWLRRRIANPFYVGSIPIVRSNLLGYIMHKQRGMAARFFLWSFVIMVLSVVAIIGVKSFTKSSNVEYVVNDVYSTMKAGTIRTTVVYCQVQDPTECTIDKTHRIEPKYKIGDHLYVHMQILGPTAKFIMGTALLFLWCSVVVFIFSGIIWFVDSALSTASASDFEP